ncbi:MAG: flavodoxin [Muribaculaceae bacterium]|nr:flavodoxin [Muribaculaceae bacterium]
MRKTIIALGAIMATAYAANAKTLVVYYSATGVTQGVAEKIANATGGDLWKLEPAQPYTDADLSYTDPESRVMREHNSGNPHTELANPTPDNWAEYDTVFIGAPIWWYQASWVINEFLTQNDFGTKTVVPFVTSASSPLADSDTKMQSLATGGNWVAGQRFGYGTTADDVNAFVTRATAK